MTLHNGKSVILDGILVHDLDRIKVTFGIAQAQDYVNRVNLFFL